MLGNLIRIVIIVALLALVIAVAPIVFEWITTAIKWIMSKANGVQSYSPLASFTQSLGIYFKLNFN